MVSRRLVLAGGAGALLIAAGYGTHFYRKEIEAVRAAVLYAYGPYEFARRIQILSGQVENGGLGNRGAVQEENPNGADGVFLNQHTHVTELSDYQSQTVTTPNNTTLYTSAVLELSGGPVEINVPDSRDRYISIAFMDMFSDQSAYIGTRGTQGKGGKFWIIGPEHSPAIPEGVTAIRSSFNDLWMLGRVFVSGARDLEAARAVQREIIVRPVDPSNTGRPFQTKASTLDDPANYLAVVNEILNRSPLTGQSLRASNFEDFGIRPGDLKSFSKMPAFRQKIWSGAVEKIEDKLFESIQTLQTDAKGWLIPPAILGNYGTNDEVRAGVSMSGFGALTLDEAAYFRALKDSDGNMLDGRKAYRVIISPEGIPVDAFWSLSLYEPDETHRLYFYKNEIDRYAIDSASEDIVYQSDGSIIFALQPNRPADVSVVWMPTPDGPFQAFLRTYLPQEIIRSNQWKPPKIEEV